MEFDDFTHLSKHGNHSSGGTLNNGRHSSETVNMIEIDNDSSGDSSCSAETCDVNSSEKCLDVLKIEEHLDGSTSHDSAAIHTSDSDDQVDNGMFGNILQSSPNSDDKVETDIPANLGPEIIVSVGGNEELHTAGENQDVKTNTGEDDFPGAASDSCTSDSSNDVGDLQEELLAMAAAIVEESVKKAGMSDSVDVLPTLDSNTISQQPSADEVDGGLPVACSGGDIATETCASQVSQNEVDDVQDETLSDDSVICLDNDDDDGDSINSYKTAAKESGDRRKMPVYIQIVRKQPPSIKLGSISSVCPPLPTTAPVGSTMPSINALLKPTVTKPVLNASTAKNWLIKSGLPLTDRSNQQTLVDRNRCPREMARLLIDIGLQLVSRRVHEHRLAQQKRKLRLSHVKKSNSDGLNKLLDLAVDPALANHLQLKMQRCSCGFVTESPNILALHYESGHERGGLQHCCFCEDYSARYSGQFVRHMELDHGLRVRVPPKPPTYLCQLCYFDTNGRAIYEKHIRVCQREFVLRSNQKPGSSHCDIPLEKYEQPQSKTVVRAVDIQPKAVSAQNEHLSSKPNLTACERGHQQKLLRIGDHLFIVVSKPGESVSSSSLVQTSGSQSLIQVDKQPVMNTTLARAVGQPTSFVQLTSQSSLSVSGVTPHMLATSVLPLSNKAVANDSMWASKIAAAAAKSVVSSSRPATSKILVQPSLKTLSVTVSKPPSTDESSRSMSPALNSTTVSKLLLKIQADQLNRGSTMTSVAPGSNNPSVNIPPRKSLLLPTVMTESATTSTPAASKTVPPNCGSDAQSSASNKSNGYIICPLCSGFIKDMDALGVHMHFAHKTANVGPSKFRCAKCVPVKWFPSKDALFKHQLSCHNICKGNSQGYCCQCEQSGISDIIEHFRQKHDTTLFSMYKRRYCSLCRLQLDDQRAFESHMISSHKNQFPSLSSLRTKIHSSEPKNSCRLCHKDDIVNIVRHMESRHQLTLNEMLRQVYCYFCSYRLLDTVDFENHMLQVHKSVFSNRDALWDEIFASRITSGFSDATGGFCGAFKCSLCDDEFVSASYRYRHLVISHPKLSFVCSLCRMSCRSKQCLMRHLKLRHTRSCSVLVKRLGHDTFEKHYHCTENSCSASSIDLCSSPETVVITDEEDDKIPEPLLKKPRLIRDLGSRNIPPEDIEEVVEIDGETVIIVQESGCC